MRIKRPAIFLDRDGTINADTGYTHRIEDWRFIPGVVKALAEFKNAGWLLVVISNQSGIGRGYYKYEDVLKLEKWVNRRLQPHNAAIDAWYYCPHKPDDNCSCRKPLPGLILKAAQDLVIDLPASWMLGDKLSDIQAGLAAGCNCGLISKTADMGNIPAATHVWSGLLEAADFILRNNTEVKTSSRKDRN